jgi:hypothetical protein
MDNNLGFTSCDNGYTCAHPDLPGLILEINTDGTCGWVYQENAQSETFFYTPEECFVNFTAWLLNNGVYDG